MKKYLGEYFIYEKINNYNLTLNESEKKLIVIMRTKKKK